MSTVAQQKYRAGMRWLLGSGAIALASVGGYFSYLAWAGGGGAVVVMATTVERGDVTKTVAAGGTVKVGNQQTLKAPTTANNAAIVETIEVTINSPIKAGDVLVRLRNPEGQALIDRQRLAVSKNRLAVQQAQTELQRAEAERTQAQQAYRAHEADTTAIRNAEIDVEQAQNRLAQRQADLPNLSAEVATVAELVEQGYLAENELQAKEEALRTAQAEVQNLAQEVQRATVNLEQAHLSHQQTGQERLAAVQTQDLNVQAVRQRVLGAEQDLTETILALRSAEAAFANTSLIRATTDGRVLAIHTKPGAVLAQDDDLVTIGNPRREEVELQLTTLQAALVKTTQPAEVTAIGVVSGTFPARVKSLDRVALSQGSNSSFRGGDPSQVQAVVVLNQPSDSLIPGGQVSIEIEVDVAADVLKLPPQLIQGEGEAAFVWVVDETNRVDQRPVDVGLVGDTETEIMSGLTAGEQVVSPPPEAVLEPGMQVELQPETTSPASEDAA